MRRKKHERGNCATLNLFEEIAMELHVPPSRRMREPAVFPTGWVYTDSTHDADCPRCFAVKGFHCSTPKGRRLYAPHLERIKHYRELIGEQEWNKRHVRGAVQK